MSALLAFLSDLVALVREAIRYMAEGERGDAEKARSDVLDDALRNPGKLPDRDPFLRD